MFGRWAFFGSAARHLVYHRGLRPDNCAEQAKMVRGIDTRLTSRGFSKRHGYVPMNRSRHF